MNLNLKPQASRVEPVEPPGVHGEKNDHIITKGASYTYCLTPPSSNSSSSVATSYFSLDCNFHELSKNYPEFRHAWSELQNRRRLQHAQQNGARQKYTGRKRRIHDSDFAGRRDYLITLVEDEMGENAIERECHDLNASRHEDLHRHYHCSDESTNVDVSPDENQRVQVAKTKISVHSDEDRIHSPLPDQNTVNADYKKSPSSSLNPTKLTFASQINHSFNASLTRSLLHHHFGLHIPTLPPGRLCPPVPNRANYVCWIRELVKEQLQDRIEEAGKFGSTYHKNSTLKYQGIDIGTGASAIYPLLLSSELFSRSKELFGLDGCGKQGRDALESKKWKFLATDIDPVAVASASLNVKANDLNDKIEVVQVADLTEISHSVDVANVAEGIGCKISSKLPNGPLFAAMEEAKKIPMFRKPDIRERDRNAPAHLTNYPMFDFVMTNPPFYSSLKEATDIRAGDGRSRTDMSVNESVYRPDSRAFDIDFGSSGIGDDDDVGTSCNRTIKNNNKCKNVEESGGEIGFVTAIMNDSQYFRHHVKWYSSLVAKKTSLTVILQRLQTLDGVWGNRGQVRMVEFRQGNREDTIDDIERKKNCNPRSRWGVAWTYERAVARCSACRVRGGLQSFEVWVPLGKFIHEDSADLTSALIKQPPFEVDLNDQKSINGPDDIKKACKEVIDRLTSYFESNAMTCVSRMRNRDNFDIDDLNRKSLDRTEELFCITATESRFQGDVIPDSQKSDPNDDNNLPLEGHFLIDAFVECIGERANGNMRVQVDLEMFCHTKRGQHVLDKIRDRMPGEVGRTNRKWRRMSKKANHQ